MRAQKARDRAFKGFWWMDPTDILLDPDGMVYRMQGPGGNHRFDGTGIWADGQWDKLMQEAQQSMDQAKRKTAYDAAHQIYLDWLPWIPVMQPIESYGVQRYIDWKPMANQDIRIQDIKLRK